MFERNTEYYCALRKGWQYERSVSVLMKEASDVRCSSETQIPCYQRVLALRVLRNQKVAVRHSLEIIILAAKVMLQARNSVALASAET